MFSFQEFNVINLLAIYRKMLQRAFSAASDVVRAVAENTCALKAHGLLKEHDMNPCGSAGGERDTCCV